MVFLEWLDRAKSILRRHRLMQRVVERRNRVHGPIKMRVRVSQCHDFGLLFERGGAKTNILKQDTSVQQAPPPANPKLSIWGRLRASKKWLRHCGELREAEAAKPRLCAFRHCRRRYIPAANPGFQVCEHARVRPVKEGAP